MLIDAYAHIGYPHYGKAEELLAIWRQRKIAGGCIALPPNLPDLVDLQNARSAAGDRVRLFGIPYGDDPADRRRNAEDQVRLGIAGMRLMPFEIIPNPAVLDLLGEHGLCLMAINVYGSAEVTRTMLDWLEQHPCGTIAAPHFLHAGSLETGAADAGAFRELLQHPRMHAIFSRHGGASGKPFPHEDLRPWVDEIAPLLTWDRILWGSEFPVLYHRDEQIDEAMGWIESLGVTLSPEEKAGYLGGNVQRLLFDHPAPPGQDLEPMPSWVVEGIRQYREHAKPVPTVRTGPFQLPLELHGRLLSTYLEVQESEPDLRFQDYLVRILATASRPHSTH